MDNEKFGKFVADIRKEKGMTQKELAQILNLSDKAVSKWERGLSFPDISVLEPLAEVMEVSVLELLRGARMEKKESLSVAEAEEMLDSSLLLSGEEIARKHMKNKFIIIFCCMLLMLLISIMINILNFRKAEETKVVSPAQEVYENSMEVE